MKQARFTVLLVFLVGIASGAYAGWWLAEKFYSERIEVLTLQRDQASERRPSTPASANVPLILYVPDNRLVIGVASLAVVIIFFLSRANRNKRRDVRLLTARVDAVQSELADEVKLRERTEGLRQMIAAELKDVRAEHATRILSRYENLRFRENVKPRVTIRFRDYGQDHVIAEKIEGLFTQYVKWHVTKDASNNPALPRAEQFKVVFDVGDTFISYNELINAFSEGDLLGVSIGAMAMTGRTDVENLVVLVLPSADPEVRR